MKNPITIILLLIALALLGWIIYQGTASGGSNPPSTTAENYNASGATVFDVAGSDEKLVETRDANGNLIESGATLKDLKTGTWVTYHPEGRVKTLATYAGGKLNGIYLELTNRGMIELEAFYKDGFLNGKYSMYKSGSRMVEQRNYLMGKLHGIYHTYHERKNKVQKEISYKNGVQDGPYRFYDEEGNVTMEYIYKDGEKVSGGIVEKKEVPAAE